MECWKEDLLSNLFWSLILKKLRKCLRENNGSAITIFQIFLRVSQ